MARKPVHLRPAGALSGRDKVWAAIRKLGEFTKTTLYIETRINVGTIQCYLVGLERGGFILRIREYRRGEEITYELMRDVGVQAPRVRQDGKLVVQGQAREHMWRSMRILGDFSVRDLTAHGSTDDVKVGEGDAKSYVFYLHKAGYLVLTSPGKSGTPARYRLLPARNTGPKPPMIQRSRQVFDPNLGEVVWPLSNLSHGAGV